MKETKSHVPRTHQAWRGKHLRSEQVRSERDLSVDKVRERCQYNLLTHPIMTMGSEETEQNNLKYALKLPQSTRERTQQPAGSQVVPGNVVK